MVILYPIARRRVESTCLLQYKPPARNNESVSVCSACPDSLGTLFFRVGREKSFAMKPLPESCRAAAFILKSPLPAKKGPRHDRGRFAKPSVFFLVTAYICPVSLSTTSAMAAEPMNVPIKTNIETTAIFHPVALSAPRSLARESPA